MSQLACDGHLRNGEWLLLGQPPWSREWYLTSQKHEWLSNDNQTKQGSPSVSKCAFKPKRNAACLPSKPAPVCCEPFAAAPGTPSTQGSCSAASCQSRARQKNRTGTAFSADDSAGAGARGAGRESSRGGSESGWASRINRFGPLGGYQVGREDEWG